MIWLNNRTKIAVKRNRTLWDYSVIRQVNYVTWRFRFLIFLHIILGKFYDDKLTHFLLTYIKAYYHYFIFNRSNRLHKYIFFILQSLLIITRCLK